MALDEILKEYCGCDGEPFDKNGELTPAGDKAYRRLIDLIYELGGIGLLSNVNQIISGLDEIVSSDGSAY